MYIHTYIYMYIYIKIYVYINETILWIHHIQKLLTSF